MTNVASQAFSAHAPDYDAPRRRLVPVFDAFYGAAIDALREISSLPTPPKRVLDLGAGTGLLSAMVADAFPDAELVALDGSAEMLDGARERLGDRASYVVADLRDELPAGPWCAVVSSLAIHHLDDDAKRALYGRVLEALTPGGVFVNAEMVLGETPELETEFHAWHREAATALGSSADEWAGAEHRMTFDRCTPAAVQLDWLRELGFADVACSFEERRFAVLVGHRSR